MHLVLRSALVAASFSCLASCGAPQPGTQTPPGPTTASSAAPAAQLATDPAPVSGFFEASIVTVAISMESIDLRRARIEFRNGTNRACKVEGYLVEWPGGKKPARPEGVVVPPGQSRDRWLRIAKWDGDVTSLTADVAKVTLQSDCPVKVP